jgi:hypothetical protein
MNDTRRWGALDVLIEDVLHLLLRDHGLTPADYICWAEAWPPLQRLRVPGRPATRRDWVRRAMQHGSVAQVDALWRWRGTGEAWPWDTVAQWRGLLATTDGAKWLLFVSTLGSGGSGKVYAIQHDIISYFHLVWPPNGHDTTQLLTALLADRDDAGFARLFELAPLDQLLVTSTHIRLAAQFLIRVLPGGTQIVYHSEPQFMWILRDMIKLNAPIPGDFRARLGCTMWCTPSQCMRATAYWTNDVATMALCYLLENAGYRSEGDSLLDINALSMNIRLACATPRCRLLFDRLGDHGRADVCHIT